MTATDQEPHAPILLFPWKVEAQPQPENLSQSTLAERRLKTSFKSPNINDVPQKLPAKLGEEAGAPWTAMDTRGLATGEAREVWAGPRSQDTSVRVGLAPRGRVEKGS